MKFARIVFTVAAVYGVIITVPLYFSEHQMSLQYPPAITHPEYFYSFAGVTLVWQILFVLVAFDPERYRNLMILSVLEKASLLPTFIILNPRGNFPLLWIPLLVIDLVFGLLFLVSFFKINPARAGGAPDKPSVSA
jgi:hypothetical protein